MINLQPYTGKNALVQLVSQFGQVLQSRYLEGINRDLIRWPLNSVSSGLYFVRIQVDGQQVVNKKLVVERWE